jgi:hypothetical protein
MPLTRSRIERALATARELFRRLGLALPEWADWSPEDWRQAGSGYDEVRQCRLGWDVTDFGSGDFDRLGRTLFTLRNGRHGDGRFPKTYAEKLLVNPERQRAPAHFHRSKREDIICRAGGDLIVTLWATDAQGCATDAPLTTALDGRRITTGGGAPIRLTPGQSIAVPPLTMHQFWGAEGSGIRLDGVGHTLGQEVSSVCDDLSDNVFPPGFRRFPTIVEDAPATTCLVGEYPPTI